MDTNNPRFWTVQRRLSERFYEFDFFQAVRILEVILGGPGRAGLIVGDSLKLSAEPVRFRAHVSLAFPPSSIAGLTGLPVSGAMPGSVPVSGSSTSEAESVATQEEQPQVEESAPGSGNGNGNGNEAETGAVARYFGPLTGLTERPTIELTQAFLGLIGPSGIMPRHYTDMLLRLIRYDRSPNRYALRDFLDIFHHRLTTLFYRAWRKNHVFMAYERLEFLNPDPDPFTRALLASAGMATGGLRNRLQIWEPIPTSPPPAPESAPTPGMEGFRVRAKIEDLVFLRYAGLFLHRPRTALGLQGLLSSYFQVPVVVQQFVGQWLRLEPTDQTRLPARPGAVGGIGSHARLGRDTFAGERVWDVQSKIRIRVGPLDWVAFQGFLPDASPKNQRCGYYLMGQLARLYLGADLDMELELVLKRHEVPACRLPTATSSAAPAPQLPPRLGWETWALSQPATRDRDDAAFPLDAVFVLRMDRPPSPRDGTVDPSQHGHGVG